MECDVGYISHGMGCMYTLVIIRHISNVSLLYAYIRQLYGGHREKVVCHSVSVYQMYVAYVAVPDRNQILFHCVF